MRKGLSPFISTAFVVLFGIVLISAVVFTLGKVQTEGVTRTTSDQLTSTSRELSTELLGVYKSVKDYQKSLDNNSVILVKQVEINLPQTVGSRNYKLSLEEPQDILLSIVQFYVDGLPVNTTATRPTARLLAQSQDTLIENKIYNIDMGLQGSSKGGTTKITGYKYNINGSTRDKIVMGDDSVIIGIDNFTISSDSNCPNNKRLSVNGYNIYTSGQVPTTMNFRLSVVGKDEVNTTSFTNPFSISVCTSISDQQEGTINLETWDANNNRGSIRKRFIG